MPAGNPIKANSQSEPDGLAVRSLRNQSSLTKDKVWRCNRSLRNNDEQESAFQWARSNLFVSFLCVPCWLRDDCWVRGQCRVSEGSTLPLTASHSLSTKAFPKIWVRGEGLSRNSHLNQETSQTSLLSTTQQGAERRSARKVTKDTLCVGLEKQILV